MKLCIDCKHYSESPGAGWRECAHPKMLSKVDGKPHELCSSVRDRMDSNSCGPNARWFEAKQ